MSKELEAWEKAKFDLDYHRSTESKYYYPKEEREEYLSIIEKGLMRLEEIDNRQPFVFTCRYDVQKIIKALEIIKEKDVAIRLLKTCDKLYDYNKVCPYEEELTQKEYDLLKEVLL